MREARPEGQSPKDQLPPQEGDGGNAGEAGKFDEGFPSVRETQADPGANDACDDGGDRHQAEDGNFVRRFELPDDRRLSRSRGAIPMGQPDYEQDEARQTAYVLQDAAILLPADHRELFGAAQELPVPEEPGIIVGNHVPGEVSGDSHDY